MRRSAAGGRRRALAATMLLAASWTGRLAAQAAVARPPVKAQGAMPVPFAVGERLEYDLKFGALKVGNGSMEVRDQADIRGVLSWHTVFSITGGIPLYRVNDRFESWFDVTTLTSRRFVQEIAEGNYLRTRRYEFFPERSMLRENGDPERPSVASPLDDGSFLYFVRTLPLELGKEYLVPRYFNPDANPVRIKVLRKETVVVPAGQFTTVVLQPSFKTKGIFSENGQAELWLTDDDRRIMVQLKTKLPFGSLNLYLRRIGGSLVKQ